ncbi:MAG: hypothetical protein H7281_03635 [Bacteriovorax sp.]|nr:hypothetical protein [Bacteriovorax sp.]
MKYILLITLTIFSFSACSKEKDKKVSPIKSEEIAKTVDPKAVVPCDSKEDLLKKFEEKKKAEAEGKPKGFSLQGGNTGCSVK